MGWLDFGSKLKGTGRKRGSAAKSETGASDAVDDFERGAHEDPALQAGRGPSLDLEEQSRDPRSQLQDLQEDYLEDIHADTPSPAADKARTQDDALEEQQLSRLEDAGAPDDDEGGYEDLPNERSGKSAIAADAPNNNVRYVLVAAAVGALVIAALVIYSPTTETTPSARVVAKNENIDSSVPSIPGVTTPYKGLLIGGGADGGMASSLNASLTSQPKVSAPVSQVQLEEILSAASNAPSTGRGSVAPGNTLPNTVSPDETNATKPSASLENRPPSDTQAVPALPNLGLPAPLSGMSPKALPEVALQDPESRKRSANIFAAGNGDKSAGLNLLAKPAGADDNASAQDAFVQKLRGSRMTGVSASIIPSMTFMISQGTSIMCVLEMAISSAQPGLTTCRLPQDIYSDTGKVLLLEKGSRVVGQFQEGVAGGDPRVFILWTRIKTPGGVIIDLNSPAADELGRSGLAGDTNYFFFKRFGGAILVSLVQDLATALIRKQTEKTVTTTTTTGTTTEKSSDFDTGNMIRSGEEIVRQMLSDTAAIKPVLYKNQGDMVQIIVARDLDFSKVYALRQKRSTLGADGAWPASAQ